MSPAIEAQILLDVFHIALLAIVVGLVTFAFIRKSNPLLRWNSHGNVWTEPFGFTELAMGLLIVAMFYSLLGQHIKMTGAFETGLGEGGGDDFEEGPEDRSVVGQISAMFIGILVYASLSGGVVAYLVVVRGLNPLELFGLRRLGVRSLVIKSLIGLVVGFLLALLAANLWNALIVHSFGERGVEQSVVTQFRESGSFAVKALIVFSAIFVAPIMEEVLYRGFLYPVFKRYSDRFFAAFITSLIFAVVHMNGAAVAPLFVFAMVLVVAYELTGCLLVPIGIHALFNFVQLLFVILGYD